MITPASDTIRRHINAGERLLWSGKQRQGIVFRAIDALLIPFSLWWGGFALFWEYSVITEIPRDANPVANVFPIVGFLFAAIGLYLMIGRFLTDRYHRARLAYGVTNHRVLVVSEAPWSSITSHEIDTLRGVRLVEHRNGRGSIHLNETAGSLFSGGGGWSIWHSTIGQHGTLFQIERAKDVLPLLRRQRDRG